MEGSAGLLMDLRMNNKTLIKHNNKAFIYILMCWMFITLYPQLLKVNKSRGNLFIVLL